MSCKYLQNAKKIANQTDIFSANYCATQILPQKEAQKIANCKRKHKNNWKILMAPYSNKLWTSFKSLLPIHKILRESHNFYKAQLHLILSMWWMSELPTSGLPTKSLPPSYLSFDSGSENLNIFPHEFLSQCIAMWPLWNIKDTRKWTELQFSGL